MTSQRNKLLVIIALVRVVPRISAFRPIAAALVRLVWLTRRTFRATLAPASRRRSRRRATFSLARRRLLRGCAGIVPIFLGRPARRIGPIVVEDFTSPLRPNRNSAVVSHLTITLNHRVSKPKVREVASQSRRSHRKNGGRQQDTLHLHFPFTKPLPAFSRSSRAGIAPICPATYSGYGLYPHPEISCTTIPFPP